MASRRPPSRYNDDRYDERDRYERRPPQRGGGGGNKGGGGAGLTFNTATIAVLAGILIIGIGIGTSLTSNTSGSRATSPAVSSSISRFLIRNSASSGVPAPL